MIAYLRKRFRGEYVYSLTESGPNKILSGDEDGAAVNSILKKLEISMKEHGSVGIAVVGHFGCAGNPVSEEQQLAQIIGAIRILREKYNDIEIIGLWVGADWKVREIQ